METENSNNKNDKIMKLTIPRDMDQALNVLKSNQRLKSRLGGKLTKRKLVRYAIHRLIVAVKQSEFI